MAVAAWARPGPVASDRTGPPGIIRSANDARVGQGTVTGRVSGTLRLRPRARRGTRRLSNMGPRPVKRAPVTIQGYPQPRGVTGARIPVGIGCGTRAPGWKSAPALGTTGLDTASAPPHACPEPHDRPTPPARRAGSPIRRRRARPARHRARPAGGRGGATGRGGRGARRPRHRARPDGAGPRPARRRPRRRDRPAGRGGSRADAVGQRLDRAIGTVEGVLGHEQGQEQGSEPEEARR